MAVGDWRPVVIGEHIEVPRLVEVIEPVDLLIIVTVDWQPVRMVTGETLIDRAAEARSETIREVLADLGVVRNRQIIARVGGTDIERTRFPMGVIDRVGTTFQLKAMEAHGPFGAQLAGEMERHPFYVVCEQCAFLNEIGPAGFEAGQLCANPDRDEHTIIL